ncbi:MAG TPA: universal stress protein [Vicinamibacteria bacterium]|nr:universal stress protein [Vicinamibacteria bacterium]
MNSIQARARPEDFLELVERAKGGRLKVYIGSAAGVGKTYRMLHEAHGLKERGIDVVLAFIETHGRAETATLIDGLEVVPRRRIEYRGVSVEEMDLDAVLARRPQVAIVDEVAHTNAPGSSHRKRYEDIESIRAAGINVICAFNVQHLESLNDLIERVTGIRVRETVPDTFLKAADQVVNVDLSVEDLLDRLKSGKIYAADKVPRALENFFTSETLRSLRELALREVAEAVERAPSLPSGTSKPRHVTGRVMVCMSSFSPRAAELLRRGSRFAGRLNTDWFVVYVETPSESPDRIDAAAQRHLLENIEKAKEMGAEVVRVKGRDPVAALLDFARAHNVAHIILGRSQRPRWKRVVGDFVHRMVDEGDGFDLYIVSTEKEEDRDP